MGKTGKRRSPREASQPAAAQGFAAEGAGRTWRQQAQPER